MSISIQDAIRKLYSTEGWDSKLVALRINEDWPVIVGNTIAKNTVSLRVISKVLIIKTQVGILKHELSINKQQLIAKINEHYKSKVIEDIRIN